jgi:raffinose/stachyose/melibiose transport system permease protein
MRPERRSSTILARLAPYAFVLPALIVVVGIVYVGIGYTGWLSILDWNGIDPDPQVVGLDNFVRIATDRVFWGALQHMLVFGAVTILVMMLLGFVLAVLLSSGAVVGQSVYKVIVFIPVVLAPAVVATAFRQILSADGPVNQFLGFIGLGEIATPWLAEPQTALGALMVIQIWQWTGFSFILYYAALTQIDPSLIEAAQLDGASSLRIVRSVIFPQLNATHATLVLLGVISVLKMFDLIFLTTGGGPAGVTEFLTTYIYRQTIDQFNAGYAAALSMVLLALSLAFTIIQLRVNRRQEA